MKILFRNIQNITFVNLCLAPWPKERMSHRDRLVVGFATTYVISESVLITINIVSSNPAQVRCNQYNIM